MLHFDDEQNNAWHADADRSLARELIRIVSENDPSNATIEADFLTEDRMQGLVTYLRAYGADRRETILIFAFALLLERRLAPASRRVSALIEDRSISMDQKSRILIRSIKRSFSGA